MLSKVSHLFLKNCQSLHQDPQTTLKV